MLGAIFAGGEDVLALTHTNLIFGWITSMLVGVSWIGNSVGEKEGSCVSTCLTVVEVEGHEQHPHCDRLIGDA
jgi:hypothetical protein